MKTRKLGMLLAALLAIALLFTACNKDPKPAGESTTDPAQTVSQTDPAEGVTGGELTTGTTDPTGEEDTTAQPGESTPETPSGGTGATQPSQPTQKPTTPQPTKANEKTGDLYKSVGTRKIWAFVVGDIYVLFRDITTPNEHGIKGKVYELHVNAGEKYELWSSGYWQLNDAKTELTLTPKNQSENGNIGVAAGESKTYKQNKGVFTVDFTFEQGGKSSIKLDLAKDALQ